MKKEEWEKKKAGIKTIGNFPIVQLDPDITRNKMFSSCFMTVTETKDWGVMGYVQSLGQNGEMGGQAYYKAEWGTFEICGHAIWTVDDNSEEV